MPISNTGVLIIDSTCLKCLGNTEVLKRVQDNMRTVDIQIRLSAINVLEVMKTPNPTRRKQLLNIVRDVSEGRSFLPWPFHLIEQSGQAHASGKKYFGSGDSGLEQAVYGNSITEQDLDKAQKIMNSLETDFTHMHDTARKKLQRFLRGNNSYRSDTIKVFLDQVWSEKSHLEYHIKNIWKTLCLPGNPPIKTILKDEIWQIFFDINGFAAFERAVEKEQPKRVHYPDLLQLMYVANSPRRMVISSDDGFLRAARAILLDRYPCVRVLECSEL